MEIDRPRAGAMPALWKDGWLARARPVASPNFDARPHGVDIELLVIHNISLPPGKFGGDSIERLFTNTLEHSSHPFFAGLTDLRVSAHFLVRRDGSLLQFVSCDQRAWHAGASYWRGRTGCNDFSIGIEIEGTDDRPFTGVQYARASRLMRRVVAAYPTISGIAGHSEIAPGRKTDPGPHFDWERFLDNGPQDEFARAMRGRERGHDRRKPLAQVKKLY